MVDTALQFTKREMREIIFSPRFWMFAIPLSLALGVVGPFGTFAALAIAPRLAYWLVITLSSYLVSCSVVIFLLRRFRRDQLYEPLPNAIAGLAGGLPSALIVWAINRVALDAGLWIGPLPLLVYGSVICAAASPVVAHFLRPAAIVQSPIPNAPRRPRILDRLPLEKRGMLSHISVQDHYVEVHTDRGMALILMRLADAIGETEAVEGLQIHRSHWVAKEAVVKVVRNEGRMSLQLKDGAILPVSRSYAPAVKEAGLT